MAPSGHHPQDIHPPMLMTPANQAGTSPPRHQPAASASASGFARTPRRYHSRAHSFANQSIYSYGSAMNAGSFHLPQSAMVGGDFTRPMTGGRHTAPSTVGGGGGLSDRETMALLELQRVLYRGSGYCDENGRERDEVKSIEARRFIEQCLETDCVYDSPIITYPNRPLMLSAHDLTSTIYSLQLPSIRLRALLGHSHNLKSWAWKRLRDAVLGAEGKHATRRLSSARVSPAAAMREAQTKGVAVAPTGVGPLAEPFSLSSEVPNRTGLALDHDDEDYGLILTSARSRSRSRSGLAALERMTSTETGVSGQTEEQQEQDAQAELWWHPWEIKSECGELGTMDCYDGFHIGFIEQAITVDFLPHWLPPRPNHHVEGFMSAAQTTAPPSPFYFSSSLNPAQDQPRSPASEYAPTYRHAAPPTSIPAAVFQKLTASWLRHSLHVTTIVHFNEAGKITYIRDSIDVRDLVESLIPFGFGRGLGWIGRRLAGFAVAGAGGLWSGLNRKVRGTLGLEVVDDASDFDEPMRVTTAPAYSGTGVGGRRISGDSQMLSPVDALPSTTIEGSLALAGHKPDMPATQASESSGKGSSAPDIDEGPAE